MYEREPDTPPRGQNEALGGRRVTPCARVYSGGTRRRRTVTVTVGLLCGVYPSYPTRACVGFICTLASEHIELSKFSSYLKTNDNVVSLS